MGTKSILWFVGFILFCVAAAFLYGWVVLAFFCLGVSAWVMGVCDQLERTRKDCAKWEKAERIEGGIFYPDPDEEWKMTDWDESEMGHD